MSNQPSKPNKPTLENLFELKRHERPPEAFWTQFEAGLRGKQLAALIPVASPWTRWSVVFGRFARFGLPVAAVAAVAVGVVTLNREQVTVAADPIARGDTPGAARVAEVSSPVEHVDAAVHTQSRSSGGIQTVVIEAAPSVASVADSAKAPRYSEEALSTEELTRSLPWLANVNLKDDGALAGLRVSNPLNVDKGPTQLAVSAFEESHAQVQPVWAPTQQNIRDAVATEVGLAPAYGDKAQRAWIARVVAANENSKLGSSRLEAEYPRELSRVGLTASTLSIKF